MLDRVADNPAVMAVAFQTVGDWLFTLTVTRGFDGKQSATTWLITVVDEVAAAMAEPPAEVSGQLDLIIEPYIEEDPACNATTLYKSLWMFAASLNSSSALYVSEGDVHNAWILAGPTTSKALLITAPWPAPPGNYMLRLVLTRDPSNESMWQHPANWESSSPAGPWIFDSGLFLIDEPPSNGSTEIYPSSGNMTTTKFTLRSSYWIDDDLPLEYRFSWHAGSIDVSSPTWTHLSSGSWSASPVFRKMIFASVGTVTVRSAAKDLLGSVSEASDAEADVDLPPVPPEDVLLEVLNDVASGGSFFATLAAVDAVAYTSTDRAETDTSYDPTQMASDLLYVVDSSMPAAGELTPEELSGAVSIINSVLTTAMSSQVEDTETTALIDAGVALQASNFISTVAIAAASIEGGIATEDASALVGSVANLLTNGTSNDIVESSGEFAALQQELMEAIVSSVDLIGDAVAASVQVGDDPVMVSMGGISITAVKANADTMVEGLTISQFRFPSGFDLSEDGRRLSASCNTDAFALQHTEWPKNPFRWAGSHVYGNLSTGDEDAAATVVGRAEAAGSYNNTWMVDQEAVQSLNIRACGVTQKVEGLQEPILFFIHAPLQFSTTDERRAVRKCMYFDDDAIPGRWSTEGVRVVNETGDGIWCETTHLSSFTAVHGSFSLHTVVNMFCPNTHIISAEGFGNIFKGTWWFEPAAVMIWTLIILHATVVVKVVRTYNRNKQVAKLTKQLSDEFTSMDGVKMIVRNCMKCRCDHIFSPETWAIFMGSVLKENVNPEDFEDAEFPETARALAIAKLRTMRSTGQRRYSSTRSNDATPTRSTDQRRYATLDCLDSVRTVRAGAVSRTRFDNYFWSVHPILRLTLPSNRSPMEKRLFKLLVTVSGSLAASALFYLSSGATPHGANPHCKAGLPWESWHQMVRAALVAFMSTFLVAGLAHVLIMVFTNRRRVMKWLGAFFLSAYITVSISYCILFVANVSLEDGCAWLVSAAFRFLMFWLVTPVFITIALAGLEK